MKLSRKFLPLFATFFSASASHLFCPSSSDSKHSRHDCYSDTVPTRAASAGRKRNLHRRAVQATFATPEEAMEDFIYAARRFAETRTNKTKYSMYTAFNEVKICYASIPEYLRQEYRALAKELEVFDMILRLRMTDETYASYKKYYHIHTDLPKHVAEERVGLGKLAKKFHDRGMNPDTLAIVLETYLSQAYNPGTAETIEKLQKNLKLAVKAFRTNQNLMYDIFEKHNLSPIFIDKRKTLPNSKKSIKQFKRKNISKEDKESLEICLSCYNRLFKDKETAEQMLLCAVKEWTQHYSNRPSKHNPYHLLNKALKLIALHNNNFEF